MHPAARHADSHFHLHVHTISKLKGHSIQAAAAYRRAERFEANSVVNAAAYRRAQELGNDGQVFDYRRKQGVAWTGIMAPMFTPKELLDAQTLWNAVEAKESRKNARMAREMIIALPHQVDLDTHIAMLRAFITAHLVSRGMVADVAIHRPPVEHGGDPRNWHAHVLLTDRPMTPEGFAAAKDRTWNARENVTTWRKAWADCHNATMAALGLPHRIDHRSLEAQRQDALQRGDVIAALDLDREPQIHVGKGFHIQGTQTPTPAAARNQAILTRNKNRAATRDDRMRSVLSKADTAAYLEARTNAQKRDAWHPDPPTFDELHATYGRRGFTSDLLRANIRREAAHAAAARTWLPKYAEANDPSILDYLTGEAIRRKPGHPWFHVSARDLAFAFYTMGLETLDGLRRNLEHIQAEETYHHPKHAKRQKPRPPIPTRTPPTFPTPAATKLRNLRGFAPTTEAIYLKRLATLNAFNARQRHEAQSTSRRRHHGLRLRLTDA